MITENCPTLYKHYPFLEFVGDSLEKHFCHWFNLEEIEGKISNRSIEEFKKGSYGQFFDACMNSVKNCLSEDEVIKTLTNFLNSAETIRKYFGENYLLIPYAPGQNQPQLGFLEKMASYTFLAADEPVTELDFKRIIHAYPQYKHSGHSSPIKNIKVFQSDYLSTTYFTQAELNCDACVINLNTNLLEPAKWGVLKKGTLNSDFYCEMSITEAEKKLL